MGESRRFILGEESRGIPCASDREDTSLSCVASGDVPWDKLSEAVKLDFLGEGCIARANFLLLIELEKVSWRDFWSSFGKKYSQQAVATCSVR